MSTDKRVAIDVLNDPGGRDQLLKLGAHNVPVVAKAENYVFGQNPEDVAELAGLQGTGHKPLPPEQYAAPSALGISGSPC